MRRIATCVAALLIGAAAPADPATGSYGGALLLHIDGATITGVFHEERGGVQGVPSFSCIFLLRGALHGTEADIVTWYPKLEGPIPGHLSLLADGARFKLDDDPGGCLMTVGGLSREPYDVLQFTAEPTWIGVGLVVASHAPLRPAPGAAAPKRPYLVDGDAVAILARRPGWAKVRFTMTDTPVEGWVRAGDLASDEPPERP